MLFTPERRTGPELLDLPPDQYSFQELEESLDDIAVVNRYLGHNRAIRKHLARMVAGNTKEVSTILDIGTGSADIPIAIVQWARNKEIGIEITAIDSNPRTIDIARSKASGHPEIRITAADGLQLQFPDRSFDFVLCSKTLHHFSTEEAVQLMKEVKRVSRRGYMIMDLRRGWVPYVLIRILTGLFTGNRLTRNDGPLSVMKSFTPEELASLATNAGVTEFTICREPFWLMVLSGGTG